MRARSGLPFWPAIGILSTVGMAAPNAALAQSPEVFNIRFQNITFQPQTFTSFNFQQPGFQPLAGGPIPFRGIQFPGFYTRYDRRENRAGANPPISADRFFTYRGRPPLPSRNGATIVRTARGGRRGPFVDSVRVSRREPFADRRLSWRRPSPRSAPSVRTARRRPFANASRSLQ